MPKFITESDLQPQDSPANGWYIIEVPGVYPNTTTDGRHITQQITPQAIEAIVAAGVPAEGLPIDKDHLSLNEDQTTEPQGWPRAWRAAAACRTMCSLPCAMSTLPPPGCRAFIACVGGGRRGKLGRV